MRKLIIIQTAVPDYRKFFFDYLYKKITSNFELYGGGEYFQTSIKSDKKIDRKSAKNYFFLRRKILFQTGIWHLLFKDVILVLELNPRIISNWIFLIIRFILKKETVLWGHAWSKKGINSKSDWVRNIMRILASKIIVYTYQQREELQIKMPNKVILVAPNAILNKDKIVVAKSKEYSHLIYVGRLVASKKPLFLVQTLLKYRDELPQNMKLFLIGEGEEKQKIIELVKENKAESFILVKNHVSDYESLKEMYAQSLFSISPGYIGLSVTQSFGYGVPMLVSKDEYHSPEIEAVIPFENSIFFETDNQVDFSKKIKQFFTHKERWISKRTQIAVSCKKKYSVETMGKTFTSLLK